jgi:hypothetical protein
MHRKSSCAADGEDGLVEQDLKRIAAEKSEWLKHVVVDDTNFYTIGPPRGGQVLSPPEIHCRSACHSDSPTDAPVRAPEWAVPSFLFT